MQNVNISLAVSFFIGLLSLLAYIYVARKQFYEVLLPKDWLSGLRWIILISIVGAIIGVVPVLVYSALRLAGSDSETLRNVAGVTGNISRLAGALLLVLIYNYRRKED